MIMLRLINLALLLIVLPTTFGERILFLNPIGSKSHKIFFMGIVEALANNGHHVTMVSAFKPTKKIKNIREVMIPDSDLDKVLSSAFTDADSAIKNLLMNSPQMCVDSLGKQEVQELRKEKFDLVMLSMFFDYCFLSFVHELEVPLIYVSPAGLFGPFADMVGNVEFPSFVPNVLMESSFPLSFKERMISTLLNFLLGLTGPLYVEPRMLSLCKESGLCSQDMPPISEMHKKTSLVIINAVRALEWPARPTMPNIIYAGGIHIHPAKNVSQELEDWIQGAGENGFIFFSLGSALTPSFMPEKYRKILVRVFGSLKERVLWKWDEDTMPDLPSNVKLAKWLPQQDILGHPKLKVFITHGGLLSTMESTYNGIPVIGMPVFADQFSNMKEAEREGWGRVVEWEKLEEETFRKLIIETIRDERLREVSWLRSALMRDVPISPSADALYWVEYVLRHRGATHIMSPVTQMRWHEVYNIDVWLLVTTIIFGSLYLDWLLLKFLLRKCCCPSSNKRNKRKRD